MLLAAMQQLATSNVDIQGDYCLGGCCKGVVVKTTRKQAIPGVMTEEAVAIDVARQLLNEIQGLDREALAQVNIRLAQGKEALLNPKTNGTSSLLNEKEWSLLPELHEVWKIASEMKE